MSARRGLSPMLCAPEAPASGVLARDDYFFELKLDGVRILADKRGDDVRLTYRKQRDTDSYPEIADAVRRLGEARLLLDGEIVAFDEHGRPDFERLGRRIQASDPRRAARAVPVVYVVFDVLEVGPNDVRALPIESRKALLDGAVPGGSAAGGLIRVHPTLDDGEHLFRLCRELRLEGVVAKRRGSPYRAGERTRDWLKIKCGLDADLVVVGWTRGEGGRARLGALDLASYEAREGQARLVARGSVGSGLDDATIDALVGRLEALEIERPAYEGALSPKRGRRFVRPEIVVSVRYSGFTAEGVLRHPVFRGVRPDVPPEACTVTPEPSGPLAPAGSMD